jgi:hypothetical protein
MCIDAGLIYAPGSYWSFDTTTGIYTHPSYIGEATSLQGYIYTHTVQYSISFLLNNSGANSIEEKKGKSLKESRKKSWVSGGI